MLKKYISIHTNSSPVIFWLGLQRFFDLNIFLYILMRHFDEYIFCYCCLELTLLLKRVDIGKDRSQSIACHANVCLTLVSQNKCHTNGYFKFCNPRLLISNYRFVTIFAPRNFFRVLYILTLQSCKSKDFVLFWVFDG